MSAVAITILNLKGGVGKTHTAWLLASVAHERGSRVLLIDTDPQGNLSSSFLGDGLAIPGVELLLHPGSDHDPLPLVRRTAYGHIDLIPASAAVAKYDLSDQASWERSDLQECFREPIQKLRSQYDYIVFDCPPRLSLASIAALCASDAILIPLEAADWGAQGIVQVTDAVHHVQRSHNPDLLLLGYLVSCFKKSRTYQRAYLDELRRHFGPLAMDTVVPDLAEFERSVTDRVPITIGNPRSRGAAIARELFDEVGRRLERRRAGGSQSRHAGVHTETGARPALDHS